MAILITPGDTQSNIHNLWLQGHDTRTIAKMLEMPEALVERELHRVLDRQHQERQQP